MQQIFRPAGPAFDKAFSRAFPEEGEEQKKRLFMLTMRLMLAFLFLLLGLSLFQWIRLHNAYQIVDASTITASFLGIATLFYAIKYGRIRLAARLFMFVFISAIAYGSYRWGATMPVGLLCYSLLIIITGVIVTPRFSLLTAAVSVIGICLNSSSVYFAAAPQISKSHLLGAENMFLYIGLLALAAAFAWFLSRTTHKALSRLLLSENALRNERENLGNILKQHAQRWKKFELQRSQKLGRFIEFGKLSAGLFHDLINPLTAVSLNVHELEREASSLPLSLRATESVSRAVRSARRIEEHIARVRKYMKDEGRACLFRADEELADICAILGCQAREKMISLQLTLERPLPVYGDPVKFYQVCANIIINSIEAYGNGTENLKRDIMISAQRKNGGYEISISDNAGGIDEKIRRQIFLPFFTTKAHGLGLGLSTAHDLMIGHFGGRIDCSSVIGQGTAFILFFPDHAK